MACNNQDGCCTPPMCVDAGSHLDQIFNDIGSLIQPIANVVKQVKTPAVQNTVAGRLGNFTANQMLMLGIIAFAVILIIEHH